MAHPVPAYRVAHFLVAHQIWPMWKPWIYTMHLLICGKALLYLNYPLNQKKITRLACNGMKSMRSIFKIYQSEARLDVW